jgi:hypothetical protein
LRAGWARRIDDLWAIDVKGCIHDAIAAGRDLSLSSPALVGPLWLAVQVSQKFIWMTWRVPGAFSFAPGQAAAAAFATTSVSRVNHIECPLLWSGALEAMQSGCSKSGLLTEKPIRRLAPGMNWNLEQSRFWADRHERLPGAEVHFSLP